MERDGFIFYKSFYEAIKDLPRDIQGEIYTAIMEYGLYGNETENLKPVARSIFLLIKPVIDSNNQKYVNGCKGGSYGGLGGRPKTPKKPLKNPKETPEEEDDVDGEAKEEEEKHVSEKEIFEEFRKIYPGKKRGLDTEFGNFIKKHKDHGKVVELLKPAIEVEMKDRAAAMRSKRFYPEPANLQTWINQRRWEQAEAIIAGAGEVTAMPEKKLPVNDAGFRDFRIIDKPQKV